MESLGASQVTLLLKPQILAISQFHLGEPRAGPGMSDCSDTCNSSAPLSTCAPNRELESSQLLKRLEEERQLCQVTLASIPT